MKMLIWEQTLLCGQCFMNHKCSSAEESVDWRWTCHSCWAKAQGNIHPVGFTLYTCIYNYNNGFGPPAASGFLWWRQSRNIAVDTVARPISVIFKPGWERPQNYMYTVGMTVKRQTQQFRKVNAYEPRWASNNEVFAVALFHHSADSVVQ